MNKRKLIDELDLLLCNVLAHEGGYSDRKKDPGGPTMYGIASNYNPDYKNLIVKQALPLSTAFDIYRQRYATNKWVQQLLAYDIRLGYLMLDTVIWGAKSVTAVQAGLNELFGSNLVEDGKVGPKTVGALSKLSGKQIKLLGFWLIVNAEKNGAYHAASNRDYDATKGFIKRHRLRGLVMLLDWSNYFQVGSEVSFEELKKYGYRQEKNCPVDYAKGVVYAYLAHKYPSPDGRSIIV